MVSTEKTKPSTPNPKLKYISETESDIDDEYDNDEEGERLEYNSLIVQNNNSFFFICYR